MRKLMHLYILGILILPLSGFGQLITNVVNPTATVTGETNKPSINTFIKGEPVLLNFSWENVKQLDTLCIEIKDVYNKLIWRTSRKVTIGSGNYKVKVPSARYGYYKVFAYLIKEGISLPAIGSRGEGYLTYCVVVNPDERTLYPDTLTRFGMQGNFSVSPSIIPYLGIRWVLSGYDWGNLEPNYSGEFSKNFEEALSLGKRYPSYDDNSSNVTINGTKWKTYSLPTLLVNTPRWAVIPGTDPGGMDGNFGAILPEKEQDWKNFCRAVAKAFKANNPGRSRNIYQITWEPERTWNFTGTAEQLCRIYEVCYQAIHDVDSLAEVVGPTISNFGPEKLKQVQDFFEAGAAPFIDGFSLHPYYESAITEADLRNAVKTQINDVVKKSTGKETRFYGTEQGFRLKTKGNYLEDIKKARTEVLQNITMLGEGASFNMTFYLYDWFLYKPGQYIGYYYNLSDNDWKADKISPKPSAPVYAASSYLLDGHISKGPIQGLEGSSYGYWFSKIDNTDIVMVMWDNAKTCDVEINVAENVSTVQIYDWMGNSSTKRVANGKVTLTIGPEPIYVKAVGKNPFWNSKSYVSFCTGIK